MIALACDHGGFELMRDVKSYLDKHSFEYIDFGTHSSDRCDYPEIVIPAARAITGGKCDKGIFICGTGVGMSIAANKVPGIRAALCSDCFTAEMSRRHNDANAITLGERVIGTGLALQIIEVFLNTGFDGARHSLRIAMLDELDKSKV